MDNFQINYEWVDNNDSSSDEAIVELSIHADGRCLTDNKDKEKNKYNNIRVSANSFAIWLAWNWWRIQYEEYPAIDISGELPHDWRMSHELTSIGDGYIWPPLTFAADDGYIRISMSDKKSQLRVYDGVKFIGNRGFTSHVSKKEFASQVKSFIENTLAHMKKNKINSGDLEMIWNLVSKDMDDKKATEERCIEAILGFDPEDINSDMMDLAKRLKKRIGLNVFSTFSAACAISGDKRLDMMWDIAQAPGVYCNPKSIYMRDILLKNTLPDAAKKSASSLRDLFNIKPYTPIENKDLMYLLGIPIVSDIALPEMNIDQYLNRNKGHRRIGGKLFPFSMIRNELNIRPVFVTGATNMFYLRPQMAMLIGDIIFQGRNNYLDWIFSTQQKSSRRQEFNQIFMNEFLCPQEALLDFLQDDFSSTAIEDASSFFQVPEKIVERVLDRIEEEKLKSKIDYSDVSIYSSSS